MVWAEVYSKSTGIEVCFDDYITLLDFDANIYGLQDHEIALLVGNKIYER